MLLDATALLTRRHVDTAKADGRWQFATPAADDVLGADDVVVYPNGCDPADALTVRAGAPPPPPSARLAVLTYGNGVVKALQACEMAIPPRSPSRSQSRREITISARDHNRGRNLGA